MDLYSENLTEVLIEIDSIRRRGKENVLQGAKLQYFDPHNYLKKIKKLNNSIITGRNGSGKTTLFISSLSVKDDNLILPVTNLKNYTKAEVINRILEASFNELKNYILSCKDFIVQQEKYSQNYKGFSGFLRFISFSRKKIYKENYYHHLVFARTIDMFLALLTELKNLLNEDYKRDILANAVARKKKRDRVKEFIEKNNNISAGIKSVIIGLEGKITWAKGIDTYKKLPERELEIIEIYEALLNEITAFNYEVNAKYQKNIFLYIDDFHEIQFENQPEVLKYLYKIHKNTVNNIYNLKISVLSDRMNTAPDDTEYQLILKTFEPIVLDNDSAKIPELKEFLLNILCNLAPQLTLNHDDFTELFSPADVLEMAIAAVGGLPRDFIFLFADIVKNARIEKGHHIQKRDLFTVVSNSKNTKIKNAETETDIDYEIVKKAITEIEQKIINVLNTNIILYPIEKTVTDDALLRNLVNLKFLHYLNKFSENEQIKINNYIPFLVDMCFYTEGNIMKPGFNYRKFWKTDANFQLSEITSAPAFYFGNQQVFAKPAESVLY